MIDEIELERVCRRAGLVKITTAKVPTYRTQKGDAAIELTKDGLKGFWFIDGERNYEKIMDDGKIYSVLQAFEAETSKYEPIIEMTKDSLGNIVPEKVGERLKEKNIGIVEDKTIITATAGAVMIPDTLTMPLLEKWKKMSTFERMLMFQNTAKENIEVRVGFPAEANDTENIIEIRGKRFKALKYVKGNFMLQEANIAFLFAWSSKIDNISIGQTAVAVYGSISVEIDGKQITRACVGVDEINTKVTPQHAIKNAATDMVKKGLASLGFNGDVYRGEV